MTDFLSTIEQFSYVLPLSKILYYDVLRIHSSVTKNIGMIYKSIWKLVTGIIALWIDLVILSFLHRIQR